MGLDDLAEMAGTGMSDEESMGMTQVAGCQPASTHLSVIDFFKN